MAISPNVLAVRINVPDVDQSFPALLQALSALHDVVARHEEREVIAAALNDAITRALAIFRREEEAMEITKDRMAVSHRAAHQRFLQGLSRIRSAIAADGPSIGLAQDVRRDVVEWMSEHHMLMDASLGRHVRVVLDRSIERLTPQS